MANYRRLISYIYAYEGNTKGKNIGFAKIEIRNGQCRLQVNVKKVYVGGNDIGVYLLTSSGEQILGKIFIRAGAGEFRTMFSIERINEQNLTMDQCYGLTIHDVNDSWHSYATIWEDAVSKAAIIDLADVTAENRRALSGHRTALLPSNELILKNASLPEPADSKQAIRLCGTSSVESEPSDPSLREQELTLQEPANPEANSPQEEELSPETEKDVPEYTDTSPKSISENPTTVLAEASAQEASLASGEGPAPKVTLDPSCIGEPEPEEPSLEATVQEAKAPSAESKETFIQKASISEQASPLDAENKHPVHLEHKAASMAADDPDRAVHLQQLGPEENDPQNIWSRIRKVRPKIRPFDYDSGCEILTINPQDIGLLPRDVWNYGNNSFLLHGYYNYRHLILAQLLNSDGTTRYLLGVPGHYYNNEKYIASMFGFPNFVLSNTQAYPDERFGYWYTDIRLSNPEQPVLFKT